MPRLALLLPFLAFAPGAAPGAEPVAAVVTSTAPTAGDRIRQNAFDGDESTSFATEKPPGDADSVTLTFDEPVQVRKVEVLGAGLDGGALEGSADGQAFEKLADARDGRATAEPGKKLKAVRLVPPKGGSAPLEVREFLGDSDPTVRRFAFPGVVGVVEGDDPELKPWAEKAARECERAYGLINEALRSEGYTPARVIKMSLKEGIDVPAYASGNRITGSVKWFKGHPDDVGAMIHEAAHVVQRYRGRRNPGWLVEGVADYVRFVLYEPQNIGRLNVKTARYDQSYRVTARFLDYLSQKYDKDIVLKLNRAMREGNYSDDIFKESTGKPLAELGDEWKASLAG